MDIHKNARLTPLGRERMVRLMLGHTEIFYPGELEARAEAWHRKDGITLPDDTIADLAKVARETGVALLWA